MRKTNTNLWYSRYKIYQHAKLSILDVKEIQWQKKNTNFFDVVIGAYHGVEECKSDKNSIGLKRDQKLAIFKKQSKYVGNSTR